MTGQSRVGKSLLRELTGEGQKFGQEAVRFTSASASPTAPTTPGGGAASDLLHNDLGGRDVADCHPIGAIAIDQIVTVGSNAEFATVQAAINSITDATAIKRYCVVVFPGRYNEAVVLTSFISIAGFCDCRESVEIWHATGPVVTFPNDATNRACLANIWLNLTPTTDNRDIIFIPDCSEIAVVNCRVEATSATNAITATMIDHNNGTLRLIGDKFIYAYSGSAAGAQSHYGIDLNGGTTLYIQDCIFDYLVGDVDDNTYLIYESTAASVVSYIKDNNVYMVLNHGAPTGSMTCYRASGVGQNKYVQNNRVYVLMAGTASGYILYCNSLAGNSEVNSVANFYRIEGGANNYWANFAAGDTCYSHFDQIEAADGHGGAGNYEFVNSPAPGETRVTGDITPDADGQYDCGPSALNRWEKVYAEHIHGYVKAGEGGAANLEAVRGEVLAGAVLPSVAGYFTSALPDNVNDRGVVGLFTHPALAATKTKLLYLGHSNNSDNDADAIYYDRNGTELYQIGNKGWMGDLYYNGVAVVAPAPPGTPDTVAIVFGAALPDANYSITLTGYKQNFVADAPPTILMNIMCVASISLNPAKAAAGFTIEVAWHVYDSITNAWLGSWDNWNALVLALAPDPGLVDPGIWEVDWQVRRYL